MRPILLVALVYAVGSFAVPALAQSPCEDAEGFHALDFWVGEWDVYVGEQKVGDNRIETILSGCAVMEHWTSARGGQGKSLFYYQPVDDEWTQVWVTQNAVRPGGLKVKTLVETTPEGGTVFRGEIPLPDGRSYLDQTILTPLEDGTVRQVIQTSRDGGETWETGWDAIYRPAEGRDRTPPSS